MTRFTTSVSERGDKQRLDGLVQFEGVVGGAGHKTSDDDHVGVVVVEGCHEGNSTPRQEPPHNRDLSRRHKLSASFRRRLQT